MCGIAGIILKEGNGIPFLLSALEALNTRGYDGYGIGTADGEVFKVGQMQFDQLKTMVNNLETNCGIAHNRWATHGSATPENTHPHSYNSIRVVHNGELDNFEELEEKRIPNVEYDLYVMSRHEPTRNNSVAQLKLFTHRGNWMRSLEAKRAQDPNVRGWMLPCRVITIGGTSYYIWTDPRRKQPGSTLFKLERGRSIRDRRGVRYVVVAVKGTVDLRLANRGDAKNFLNHMLKYLWLDPLKVCEVTLDPDEAVNPNPDRHSDFWDVKVVGALMVPRNGGRAIVSVEQQVTTIKDHLNALCAYDSLNPDVYALEKLVKYICPLWFPYRKRAHYREFKRMGIPYYGVDWEHPQTLELLKQSRRPA